MAAASLFPTGYLFTWTVYQNKMEKVYTTRITVKKKAETRYFSIRLPRDAQRIIAVEASVRLKNQISASEVNWQQDAWIKLLRNRVMGQLKIQATGLPDVFYAAEIKERDRNTGQGDCSKEYYNVSKVPVAYADGRDYGNPVSYWLTEPWTHGGSRLADPVDIEYHNQILTGYYRDEYGKAMKADTEYTVQVYLWYEINKQ